MRDFFINAFEYLLHVIVVLMLLGVIAGAGAILAGAVPDQPSGPVPAVLVLVIGLLYVTFVAGLMYLGLGIYQNTRRMADALERRGL